MTVRQIDSYISKVLQPGEVIVHRGAVHWIVFAWPAVMTAGAMLVLMPFAAVFPALNGLVFFAMLTGLAGVGLGYLRQISDELVLTDRRIVSKFGFITRTTFELRLDQVEGVQVVQSFLGRILDYGTIFVTGTGGLATPIPMCAQPLNFRRAISAELSRRSGHAGAGWVGHHGATGPWIGGPGYGHPGARPPVHPGPFGGPHRGPQTGPHRGPRRDHDPGVVIDVQPKRDPWHGL